LYFAKLWYYEKLYPIILVAEALERLGSQGIHLVDDSADEVPTGDRRRRGQTA
jgi:hypothetical protein